MLNIKNYKAKDHTNEQSSDKLDDKPNDKRNDKPNDKPMDQVKHQTKVIRKDKTIDEKKFWTLRKKISFSAISFILLTCIFTFRYFILRDSTPHLIKFEEEEVMRVNNQKVEMNEFLLYAADVYQGYNLQNETAWNSEITDSQNNTISFEEQVKGTICEQIRMTKVLCMKAQEDGISLSSDEKKILIKNAQTYFSSLLSAHVINEGLTVDLITKFYEENALAQKVYNHIIEGYETYQNSIDVEEYDTENTELSEKEFYFVEQYHNLEEKYDKEYDYYASINWDLLELLSFSEISKDDTTITNRADTKVK